MCLRTKTTPNLSYDMSMDVFKLAIDQSISSRFVKPVIKLIGLGEPLLNPNIASMVEYAKRKNLTLDLVSNFTKVDRKTLRRFVAAQLDYVGVSIDSASSQIFERIRIGAKLQEVIDNVRLLIDVRKEMNSLKPQVFFRTTVCSDNVRELSAISELAKTLPVDGVAFSKQIISTASSGVSECASSATSKSNDDKSFYAKRDLSVCPALRRCYITYDGKIMPCNFLMEIIPRAEYPQFEFGDITRDSIRNIWFSRKYKRFRLDKARGHHPYFCRNCTSES
jgi:radical SAM protein with 4Fe4S-binding SPASM domain